MVKAVTTPYCSLRPLQSLNVKHPLDRSESFGVMTTTREHPLGLPKTRFNGQLFALKIDRP